MYVYDFVILNDNEGYRFLDVMQSNDNVFTMLKEGCSPLLAEGYD